MLTTALLVLTATSASARPAKVLQPMVLAGSFISNITVSTSNIVQCKEGTVSWTGTEGAVSLVIGTGGMYVSPVREITSFSGVSGNSQTWTVNRAAGSDALYFQVTDSTGKVGYTQGVSIGASDDSSCLDGADSGTGTGSTSSDSATSETEAPQASSDVATPTPDTTTDTPNTASAHDSQAPESSSQEAAPAPAVATDSSTSVAAPAAAVPETATTAASPPSSSAKGPLPPGGQVSTNGTDTIVVVMTEQPTASGAAPKVITQTFTGSNAQAAASSAIAAQKATSNGAGALAPLMTFAAVAIAAAVVL